MLLELNSVSKSFDGLTAVNSISTTVPEGQILGLIGPNGAGKTTLFNLITGVYRPSRGRILFSGTDISSAPPHARCWMGIARTFQLVRPFPSLSVLENVAVGRVYGRDGVKSGVRAKDESMLVLEKVGLAARASALAASLTLVDRKKLELARALATRPRLLLLDELLAGLNPAEVPDALELIRGIHNVGTTVIMVEHLVKALFGFADRILVLNAGDLIADGTPQEISRNQDAIDAYLGTSVHGRVA
jgi:branched-chain amino acid transport system ATP-binding protein